MKENAIKKINTMGKVGKIIATILTVLLSIGLAFVLVATIFSAVLPKDFIHAQFSGMANIDIDLNTINEIIPADLIAQIESGAAKESANLEIKTSTQNFIIDDITTANNHIYLKTSGDIADTVTSSSLFGVLIVACIYIVFSIISTLFARNLCKSVQTCDSPFAPEVIRKLKLFAYSLLPWTIVNCIADTIVTSFFNNSVKVTFSLDITTIIVVLVILALAYIFQYGAVLQQESDETL